MALSNQPFSIKFYTKSSPIKISLLLKILAQQFSSHNTAFYTLSYIKKIVQKLLQQCHSLLNHVSAYLTHKHPIKLRDLYSTCYDENSINFNPLVFSSSLSSAFTSSLVTLTTYLSIYAGKSIRTLYVSTCNLPSRSLFILLVHIRLKFNKTRCCSYSAISIYDTIDTRMNNNNNNIDEKSHAIYASHKTKP